MKNKKFYALSVVACFCAGIVFTGCNKDDDPVYSSITSINAKVENGTMYDFDKVKAVMYNDHDEEEFVVAEGNYTNGGFLINLPETVDQRYLSPMIEQDGEELFPEWLTISDPSVMGGGISLEGYKSGSYQGDFYYMNMTQSESLTNYSLSMSEATFLYVDKNVTLKGSHTETERIEGIQVPIKFSANAPLKKGWNILYLTVNMTIKISGTQISANGTTTITTKNPGGLKWYYEDDMGDIFAISSVQKSNQPEIAPIFGIDAQKMISKYRIFSRTK